MNSCDHQNNEDEDGQIPPPRLKHIIINIVGSGRHDEVVAWSIVGDIPSEELEEQLGRMMRGLRAWHHELGTELYSVQVQRADVRHLVGEHPRPVLRVLAGGGTAGTARGRLALVAG